MGQGNEENDKINSLCAETFTFTSFPSQIERNISKCQSQQSEAHLKESKFRSEKNTMKFIQTMSEVDMLGRLYEKLNASGSVKDFMSIVHNIAEGHLPIEKHMCSEFFIAG